MAILHSVYAYFISFSKATILSVQPCMSSSGAFYILPLHTGHRTTLIPFVDEQNSILKGACQWNVR